MLSKTTEYAIRSLVYISVQNKKGMRPGFKEIAKEINSPEQFTAKVLQKLTKNKLVHSMKGRGGGFFFSENEFPSLYDTIIIMEGENYFTKCGFGLKNAILQDLVPCIMNIWLYVTYLTSLPAKPLSRLLLTRLLKVRQS